MSGAEESAQTEPVSQSQEPTPDGLFLRQTSGVIRTMSSRDGMYYGFLSAAALYSVILWIMPLAGLFPQANVLLANLLGLGFFVLVWFVYSNLSSAMPRSGGDYVFTSRLLRPVIGFAVAWGAWIFWGLFWTFMAATTLVNGVFSPMLSAIGVSTGNEAWTNAAESIQDWHVRLPIVFVLVLASAWVMIAGMDKYMWLQKRILMPLTLGGVVMIALSYIFVSHDTFVQNFDRFQAAAGGLPADQIIAKASELGFGAGQGALWDTLGATVLITFCYVWTIWSAELLGEIKQANQLRTTYTMFFGAGLLTFVTFMIAIWGTFEYFGYTWFRSFSWLVLNNPDALGGSWDFRGAASLFYIPTLNVGLGILLFLCILAPCAQSLFNPTLSSSRLLLAQAFDRALPNWLGAVNARGVPYGAIWFCTGVTLVLAVLIEFVPSITQILYWGTWVTLLGLGAAILAGTVFPYTARSIYAVSPGARMKVLGVPAVTFVGAIALGWLGIIMLVGLFHPSWAMFEPGSARVGLVALIAVFVGAIIGFFVMRHYRAQQGINIDYAFKSIPRA